MLKIIEIDRSIKDIVDQNDGYCPCVIFKTPETKCICKEFRDTKEPCICHCGRFKKIYTEQ